MFKIRRHLVLYLLVIITYQTLLASDSLVAYLPSYRDYNEKQVAMLTDLIIFSAEPSADGNLKMDPKLTRLLSHISKNRIKGKRYFLCIGGWGRSKGFPEMTKTAKSRKRFIDNLQYLLKVYKLDGVDYDWEHPKGDAQEAAYGDLIKETAARGVLVSIAVAPWQKLDKSVFKSLYRVNLMSYDNGGEHSTLKGAEKDIVQFLKTGCPAEKLALGVPFYARHIKDRKSKTYAELVPQIKDTDTDLIDGYYFNNRKTLRDKVKLIKDLKLNGIMIWEIGQDDAKQTLLKTLYNGMTAK